MDRDGVEYPQYFVSESGQIGSTKSGVFLVLSLNMVKSNGYFMVTMCRTGFPPGSAHKMRAKYQRGESVHQLVARSWIGMPPNKGMCINHKDFDKSNNHASNLEWTTPRGNSKYSADRHRMPFGENAPGSKLKEHQIVEIRKRREQGVIFRLIADEFGVSKRLVIEIVKRRIWKHVA